MRKTHNIPLQTSKPFRGQSDNGPWVIRCAPGLARLATAELIFRRITARDDKNVFLRQRNHDLIFIPRTQGKPKWTMLRIPEEIHYCVTFGRYKISNAQLERLSNILLAQKKHFHLVITADGSHFSRQDLKRWLSRELKARRVLLSEDTESILYVFCIDEAYYICLPHNDSGDVLYREKRAIERSGSLPPSVAAAMAFMGKPRSEDIILDPVCGTGTLLAEAYALAPNARLIGVDIDISAFKAAQHNLSHLKRHELIHGDGAKTGLPQGSVTLFLANLPFGKQYGNKEENPQLYKALLAEMQRVGAPRKWRAVLLSSDIEAVEGAVANNPLLVVSKRVAITVRGERATIFLVNP